MRPRNANTLRSPGPSSLISALASKITLPLLMSQGLLTKRLYWPHVEEKIHAVYLSVYLYAPFSKFSALIQLDTTLFPSVLPLPCGTIGVRYFFTSLWSFG
jgi:hypothetical protein